MTDEQKKRAAYQDKLKAQLNEWQGEIDKLNAKVEKVEAEAKIEYQKQIDKLKALQDESWDYFEKLRNASERHWDEIKAETELKWTKMNNALKAAFDKLK
ncbi:MAG: coiled coil domain-containing protein [Gammaproteobacteria bacterium]